MNFFSKSGIARRSPAIAGRCARGINKKKSYQGIGNITQLNEWKKKSQPSTNVSSFRLDLPNHAIFCKNPFNNMFDIAKNIPFILIVFLNNSMYM